LDDLPISIAYYYAMRVSLGPNEALKLT